MQHYGRKFKCTIVRIFQVMVPTATAIQFIYVVALYMFYFLKEN